MDITILDILCYGLGAFIGMILARIIGELLGLFNNM